MSTALTFSAVSFIPVSAAQTKLCPSCAGQLKPDAASCPWCGAGLMSAEATRVAAAPPPVAANLTPDIGLGRTGKELPPLPPPPKSLPITKLNPTQVVLRTVIVLGALYLLFLLGRTVIERSASQACNTPGSEMLTFCQ